MDVSVLVDQLPQFKVEDLSVNHLPYDNSQLNLLAGGAVGRIYSIDQEPTKVLKYQQPPLQAKTKCEKEAYDVLHPFKFYSTPYPTNRQILTIPNVISEAIIGGMLTKLIDAELTINYPKTYEVGYLTNEAASYIILDKVSTDIASVIKSEYDFLVMLFQLLHGLMVGQESISFTHYDLHIGNLLYVPTTSSIKYPLINKNIVVRSRGFILKISDFGLSVGKYKGNIVNPLPYNCVQRTYGVFNPYYDILTFWGSLLIDVPSLRTNPLLASFKRLNPNFIIPILKVFFSPPEELQTYTQITQWIVSTYYSQLRGQPWWRPRDIDWVRFFHLRNCHQLLNDLANMLINYDLAYESEEADIQLKRLSQYTLNKLTPEVDYFTHHEPTVQREIIPGILINSYSINYRSLVKDYNLVPSKGEEMQCQLNQSSLVTKSQYITEVIITPSIAIKNGYKFNLDCCKSSLQDYLMLNQLDGVAINGGFFDLNKSYLPTALFKNQRFRKTNIQIPEIYWRYFGMYHVNERGILHIGRIAQEKLGFEQYEACGPLLVYNGKITITEDIIRTLYENKLIFQCANPVDPTNNNKYLTSVEAKDSSCNRSPISPDTQIPNCTAISGGELSHIGNPNPRSLLLSRTNSQGQHQIVFIVIEGRNERGDGMDILEIARFAVERFHADRAISLDGGSSSNIVAKIPGNPVYYVVNQKKESKYPVGSIISFTKKAT